MAERADEGRAPLTRDRVLEAAVALADAQGIDALTMRNLGQALGVAAMSLYNHVPNKEAIHDGIVDRVVAEIQLPPPGTPWKEAMRQRAWSAHAALVRHPWACPLLMSTLNVGPAMIRYVDGTLGFLFAAGFTFREADSAWNAMDSHIYGFTLQKLNFPMAESDYQGIAAAYLPTLSPEVHPNMRALTREVAEGRHDGRQDLGFGLELILDGLERMLAASERC
jgi:AcrR family transcriptional regulator